jgi:hypothetical protein
VVSGPNVAVGNGWTHNTCNECGGNGDVNQNSGNTVWAPASNSATQTNNQSNVLDQTQTVTGHSGCCSGRGDVSQSADQSNDAENSVNQRAYSAPVVVSHGNYAFWNAGDVNQNSGNTVWARASNSATQTNNQSNVAHQSQTVSGDGCCPEHGCASCHPSCESNCEPECEHECGEPKRCEPNPCKQNPCEPEHGPCGHPRRDCE